MNKITIITPCCRPQNLAEIAESINIPRENYRWIVVIDAPPQTSDFRPPASDCELFFHHNPESRFGNAQRNFALDIIKNDDTHVYFLDDDTTLHPNLWEAARPFDMDFIHFNQCHPNGSHRIGGKVEVNHIDSGNVLIHASLIGNTRWLLKRYGADGVFITDCFERAKTPIYLHKTLSIYNALRV